MIAKDSPLLIDYCPPPPRNEEVFHRQNNCPPYVLFDFTRLAASDRAHAQGATYRISFDAIKPGGFTPPQFATAPAFSRLYLHFPLFCS